MNGICEAHVKHVLFKAFSRFFYQLQLVMIWLSRLTLICLISYKPLSCWPDSVEMYL